MADDRRESRGGFEMSSKTDGTLPVLILRIGIGLPFVAAGAFSALNWQATLQFNAILTGAALAPASTAAGVCLLIAGGLSILFGYKARLGALCILLFLLPASARHLVAAQEATEMAILLEVQHGQTEIVERMSNLARRGQLASFVKNMGLTGVAVFFLLGGVEPTRGSVAPGHRLTPPDEG